MLRNSGVTLVGISNEKQDEAIIKRKPYLERFSSFHKLIAWKGSEGDYKELDDVLEHVKMDQLKRMLLGGAPYLYKKDENKYPMTHAAFYSRIDVMEIILERHKNEGTLDDTDEFQFQTCHALHTACTTNCGEIARALLQVKTPVLPSVHLNQAAETGSTAVLDEILSFFPDMDVSPKDGDGNTPLHKAVQRKHAHTVQYLLNRNASPNTANNDGYTSVHVACQSADEEILYLLTTRGGDVNVREKTGKTPLLVAAQNGKQGCIHILAAAGANLDQRDNFGNVPLIAAASQGHTPTVRELILNGASFDVTDNERYNALERAITGKKDCSAASIIRLSPQVDYVGYYLQTVEISLLKLVQYRLIESLRAILDRMVVPSDPYNFTKGVVRTEYLDIDTSGRTPGERGYQENKAFFLQRLAGLENEDIAYHGTIRLLVDKKMRQFGSLMLGVEICFYVSFLVSLAYSLIVASYQPIQLSVYTRDPLNISRIVTELYVLVYFFFNLATEGVEFCRVSKLTYLYLQDKQRDRRREERRAATVEKYECETNVEEDDSRNSPTVPESRVSRTRSVRSRVNNFLCVRVLTGYFSDKSNYMDVLGLSTLFIFIILRLTCRPAQWIFATLTFLFNGLRLFKLVALLPHLGPYTNTIYQILVNDVPLFSSLFLITLLIFTGGFFISLRTPYTVAGFLNASLMTDTHRVRGVDNEVQWVFLSGLRALLEGNIFEDQFLYRELNWLAASVYMGFLFLNIVVFLNVFIAQLSDTYGVLKHKAEMTSAWQRLNYVVKVERRSLLSVCVHRKKYFTKEIPINKEDMFQYYGVHSIKNLNVKNSIRDVEVKAMLASIQNQQAVSRKTHEIEKLDAVRHSHPPPQQHQSQGSEEINRLNNRIDQLIEEMRHRDARLEETFHKSNLALLKMFEEKLKEMK